MTAPKDTFFDLGPIRTRVLQKRQEASLLPAAPERHNLVLCFFDLAHEFEAIEDFYRLCVVLPEVFFQLECQLYLLDESDRQPELMCGSRSGLVYGKMATPSSLRLGFQPYETGEHFVVPLSRKLPAKEGPESGQVRKQIGLLTFGPLAAISEPERLFLIKYGRCVSHDLHLRLVSQQSIRHLKFINTLVMDIEHNVIIPNMYFKYIFNQLSRKIEEMRNLQETIRAMKEVHGVPDNSCRQVLEMISTLHQELVDYDQELRKHHASTSLFLESLFRRDHFEQGQFVLRPRRCFVEKEIILPQLEHFASRFRARGITIERPTDMLEEDVPLMVDVGLLAQVYANLFSNAVKYTEEVVDYQGKPRKSMTYGREFLRGYFGPGKDAIKFNVFTTGRHLSGEEAGMIFTDGYRRQSDRRLPGTGHGLSFLKQVVEIHGGLAGYEPTPEGNNFYFIIPLSSPEPPA